MIHAESMAYPRPRNHIPWIIIGVCYLSCMIILLLLRHIMNKENKRRDAETRDTTYDEVYIERVGDDGSVDKFRVDKVRRNQWEEMISG